jgi:hypothetical protein
MAQERHRFDVEGEDEVLGTPALRVRFDPLPPYVLGLNEWVGPAFVDRRTFQPLRVEAYQVSDWEKKTARYTTDFDVVEHGMRFPGQVRVRSPRGILSVTQTYKRYRFFGVRARQEIHVFVLGRP